MRDRQVWESSISSLIKKAQAHTDVYTIDVDGFQLSIHPNVYSPKYFPESSWYGRHLAQICRGKDFLEVGVGSGIISLHVARTGSKCFGVDINPDAVIITRQNFDQNKLKGDIRVSDLYSALDPGTKVDYIFWNHPWQCSDSIVEELKTEKTFDKGYEALSRYIEFGHERLHPGGAILIGSSCYAEQEALKAVARRHQYEVKTEITGASLLEDGTEEVYYILRLEK